MAQRNILIKPVDLSNIKRNPYRIVEINQSKQTIRNEMREVHNSDSEDESKTTKSLVDESEIV